MTLNHAPLTSCSLWIAWMAQNEINQSGIKRYMQCHVGLDWSGNGTLDIIQQYNHDYINEVGINGLHTIISQVRGDHEDGYLDGEGYMKKFMPLDYSSFIDLKDNSIALHKLNLLDNLIYTTQKGIFTRDNKDTERWQINEPKWANEKTLCLALEAGFADGISPKKQHYDAAIVLGATGPTIDKRVGFLEKMITIGPSFGEARGLNQDTFPKLDYSANKETENSGYKLALGPISFDKIYGAATKSRLFAVGIDGPIEYRDALAIETKQNSKSISEYDLMQKSMEKLMTSCKYPIEVLDAEPKIGAKRATTGENAESFLSAIERDGSAMGWLEKSEVVTKYKQEEYKEVDLTEVKDIVNLKFQSNTIKALVISNSPYII